MIIGLLIILAVILLDQLTKYIVVQNFIMHESLPIIEDVFHFTRRFNTGGAWSILSGQMPVLILITLVGLGFFFYFFKDVDFKNQKFYSIGISLMIGGAIGNFIDRIRLGGVVDFIDVYIGSYDFPVFNIADMALDIGVVMFIIAVVFYDKRDNHSEREE